MEKQQKKKNPNLSLCLPVDGPKCSELNETVPGVYKRRDTHCITYNGSNKARVKNICLKLERSYKEKVSFFFFFFITS